MLKKDQENVKLTDVFGKNGAIAPETILSLVDSKGKIPVAYDKSNDIYTLGILFFYFLNPFIQDIQYKNVSRTIYTIDIKNMFKDKILSYYYSFYSKLIEGMTSEDKENRWTIDNVISELENILKTKMKSSKGNSVNNPNSLLYAPYLYLTDELSYLKEKVFNSEIGEENLKQMEKCYKGKGFTFVMKNVTKPSKIITEFYRKLGVVERAAGIYGNLQNIQTFICFVKYMKTYQLYHTKLLI